MKEKYITQRFPRYFVFGKHPDGRVDLADESRDIATLTREQADILIKDRNAVIDTLHKMACAFDKADSKAFDDFWYK